MANNNTMSGHEMLEFNELMNSEMMNLKKNELNVEMVQDQELKAFINDCLNSKKNAIQQMKDIVNKTAK